MTKEAIDQIFNRAQQGDVTAMALVGQMFLEGKYIQEDRTKAIHFLRQAADYNCLYARDLLQDELCKPFVPNGQQNPHPQQQNNGGGDEHHDYMAELTGLIGLGTVKTEVESLRNLIKIQAMRAQQGLPNTNMSYHMVFTGNPGTGKTTVARIVAGIYNEIGILKKGHLVETDRAGLVAEYVGKTAPKTNAKIDEALDGVLFIDEAYTLVGEGSDYGSEAIATLLKRMEDDRNRLVVILAGYTNEIKVFIDSNKNFWFMLYDQGCCFVEGQTLKSHLFSYKDMGIKKGKLVSSITEQHGTAVLSFSNGTLCRIDGIHKKVLWTNPYLTQNHPNKDDGTFSFIDSRNNY